jgi:hypothetical protein
MTAQKKKRKKKKKKDEKEKRFRLQFPFSIYKEKRFASHTGGRILCLLGFVWKKEK